MQYAICNMHAFLLSTNVVPRQSPCIMRYMHYCCMHYDNFYCISVDYVAYVLEKERPDGILLTFGGQSALNVGIELDRMGVLDRLGVQVLGTPIRTLEVSEDRDLFVQALKGMFRILMASSLLTPSILEIDIPVAQSTAVSTVNVALAAAEKIGYPVIMRSAFTLGGLGSGFANNPEELRDLSACGLALSPQVLVERSMKGWKEVEYEVVRDGADVRVFLHFISVQHLLMSQILSYSEHDYML